VLTEKSERSLLMGTLKYAEKTITDDYGRLASFRKDIFAYSRQYDGRSGTVSRRMAEIAARSAFVR
jgi:hypothetical protein